MSLSVKDKYYDLLNNLWYTWNPRHYLPVIDLYGDGWRKNPPPKSFIQDYGPHRLGNILENRRFDINKSYEQYIDYLNSPGWFAKYAKENPKFNHLYNHPIVYFCMEFGLADWLQIYSGGLGVLAGDFLKEASDLGVPMMGVGLFYHQGYFHQDFDETGKQVDRYITQDPKDYPFETVKDHHGQDLLVDIEIENHVVYAKARKLKIGRVFLYLLDTNIGANELYADRMITAHLYGGDSDTRIRQEILLGIGGARLIEKIGVDPAIYHMNEGHSGFLVLEVTKQIMNRENLSFQDALNKVSSELVFTNHTLKQAGNDIFPYPLIEKYLKPYTDDLQTDIESIYEMGKDLEYGQGDFSMTILGLRFANVSNAVSKLHGKAAKKIWPHHELVPVTNGIHVPTWISVEMYKLLEKYLGKDWHENPEKVDFSHVDFIKPEELWHVHTQRKNKLLGAINKELGLGLNAQALTIAWSRRLTSYKRPDLIISDVERMERIVNSQERPVQILIAGKAHPRDTAGVELLQKINQKLCDVCNHNLYNKITIVPGYNWQLARRMVSGADVWLNTPYRYEEASGTSGMKACLNGVLQLTTLDGWTDEVDWSDKGFVVDHDNPVQSLHDKLEYEVAPLFFDQNIHGFNEKWVQMMKESIKLTLEHYSMTRMVKEYFSDIYERILSD